MVWSRQRHQVADAVIDAFFQCKICEGLPTPVRVADDWEERYLIQEDLKSIMGLPKIRGVQELIQQTLSGLST